MKDDESEWDEGIGGRGGGGKEEWRGKKCRVKRMEVNK